MKTGKILLKTRKFVEGSLQQHAWQDVWRETIDIDYDGDLSEPGVMERIKKAWFAHVENQNKNRRGGYQAALRTPNPDKFLGISGTGRHILLECSCVLCD